MIILSLSSKYTFGLHSSIIMKSNVFFHILFTFIDLIYPLLFLYFGSVPLQLFPCNGTTMATSMTSTTTMTKTPLAFSLSFILEKTRLIAHFLMLQPLISQHTHLLACPFPLVLFNHSNLLTAAFQLRLLSHTNNVLKISEPTT